MIGNKIFLATAQIIKTMAFENIKQTKVVVSKIMKPTVHKDNHVACCVESKHFEHILWYISHILSSGSVAQICHWALQASTCYHLFLHGLRQYRQDFFVWQRSFSRILSRKFFNHMLYTAGSCVTYKTISKESSC